MMRSATCLYKNSNIDDLDNSFLVDNVMKYEKKILGSSYFDDKMLLFPRFVSDFRVSQGSFIHVDELEHYKGQIYNIKGLPINSIETIKTSNIRNIVLEETSEKDFRSGIGHIYYEGEKTKVRVINVKFKMGSRTNFSNKIIPLPLDIRLCESIIYNNKRELFAKPLKLDTRDNSNEVFIIQNENSKLKDYDFSTLERIVGFNSFFSPENFMVVDNGQKYFLKNDGFVFESYNFLTDSARKMIELNQEKTPGSQNIIFLNNPLDTINLENQLYKRGINFYNISSLFLR